MTTVANTNNSGAVGAGVGGYAPAPTALALYRHALDLCERLGISPQSVHHWRHDDPPSVVYVWAEEWRPEWGKLCPVGPDLPDVVQGVTVVEGVMFRCGTTYRTAQDLGLMEGA